MKLVGGVENGLKAYIYKFQKIAIFKKMELNGFNKSVIQSIYIDKFHQVTSITVTPKQMKVKNIDK